MPSTLLDKIWETHLVGRREDGRDLIYVDRHVLHDLHASHALKALDRNGRGVRRPDLTVAVADHTILTRRIAGATRRAESPFTTEMRAGCARHGVPLIDVNDSRQGIVHVVSPELGIALPGFTLACPDSHAATVGALGTLAFACGTSELEHVLATQVVAATKPKSFRIRLDGKLRPGVTAKDAALHLISRVGVAAGRGYAIEYAGAVVEAMQIEERLTLCNLSSEFGARTALIAPDERTFEWCRGRPFAPVGEQWDAAVAWWRTLYTDADAVFDRDVVIDCSELTPQLTWGTDPSQVIGVGGSIPELADLPEQERAAAVRASKYIGLEPGQAIAGVTVDRVFIGSCANSLLPDLRDVASLVKGRHVAPGVRAVIVPGSSTVRRAAESEGLDAIFLASGFEWHEAGCSMCAGVNGDVAAPGERCISTTNRNFENRQGAGVRTHLASPLTAAAAALAGRIVDPGMYLQEKG